MKKRLFVDMDGTLAEFKNVGTLETLYEKDYFLNLKPQINVVKAINEIIKKDEVEVFILSAVLSDSKYALNEKNEWLNKFLPEIDKEHRIFPPCGEDKKNYIPEGVRGNDFLLDDYTYNLMLWSPPAEGIKLLNGINHTRGTWQGSMLSFSKDFKELANDILNIVLKDMRIRDTNEANILSKIHIEESLYRSEIMTNKNFESIKAEIADNYEKRYEDTVKAIIAIEKNLTDKDMINYVYNDYMEGSYMLMNDCIDDAINEYGHKHNITRRKTLEDVKNKIDNYKNMNPIENEEGKKVVNKKIER